jgi:murein DD-endopeptidase MepM/ murein hydrolase activator NlpD
VASKEPAAGYRGRRRLPKLPGRRYAGVVATAFLGAAIVAFSAGAVMPEDASGGLGAADGQTQALSVEDRLSALDKANRSQDRPGPALSINQGAPDVWLLPLADKFIITTFYEMRWGEFHYGVDLALPCGKPFYAAHAGTVTLSGVQNGYGNVIYIDHGNGFETIYGHASKRLVVTGQKVAAGQLIALIGSTGFSTGCHLHFEVNVNGQHTDPMKFMLQHGVDVQKRIEAANGGTVIS